MNIKSDVRFRDGTRVKQVEEAIYLGGSINTAAKYDKELQRRISIALATCKQLNVFRRGAGCSKKWKLQVYNAVVSQLIYGLETLYLNDSLIKRLNAFHI